VIRLMVVDDHQVLRQGVRHMIEDNPDLTVVCEADDGVAALERVEAAQPDVVLLDIRMDRLDGLETLKQLHERWPSLAVVIFSMYDDAEYVEEAVRSGASGYLLKSVATDELLRAIRAAASGRGYLQAEITRPILARVARLGPTPHGPHLTTRERELLELLADGLANKQIARRLGISEATVKSYLSDLFDKLGATDRAHAVGLALRSHLID
jgi:DNA-binding NarL/FixJ family response regulator